MRQIHHVVLIASLGLSVAACDASHPEDLPGEGQVLEVLMQADCASPTMQVVNELAHGGVEAADLDYVASHSTLATGDLLSRFRRVNRQPRSLRDLPSTDVLACR